MEVKEQNNLPGDRPTFFSSLGKPRKKYAPSDIEGFLQADDAYTTQDQADYEGETGLPGKTFSREEAIRELAKNEGITNPSGDLEELLRQIQAKKKKKDIPYEEKISRPGI
jgi:hypothetical protein